MPWETVGVVLGSYSRADSAVVANDLTGFQLLLARPRCRGIRVWIAEQ